ncbi:MAG: hypothetical protein ACOCVF_01810 [bacterium]
MDEREEFNKISEEILKKLSDPKVAQKFQRLQDEMYDLIGYPIEVNFVYARGVEDYMERYEELLQDDSFEFDDSAITVEEFIQFLSNEDKSKKIYIDPIYLKKGVNEINNLIVLDNNDVVLIVPKRKEE